MCGYGSSVLNDNNSSLFHFRQKNRVFNVRLKIFHLNCRENIQWINDFVLVLIRFQSGCFQNSEFQSYAIDSRKKSTILIIDLFSVWTVYNGNYEYQHEIKMEAWNFTGIKRNVEGRMSTTFQKANFRISVQKNVKEL